MSGVQDASLLESTGRSIEPSVVAKLLILVSMTVAAFVRLAIFEAVTCCATPV